jgi:S1-C subfamily serine protease
VRPFNRGNSGGPLLDTGGQIVGMVAAKLNALKFAKATGNIPENINFAIKTGTLRDFLDNSVVGVSSRRCQKRDENVGHRSRCKSLYALDFLYRTGSKRERKKSDD